MLGTTAHGDKFKDITLQEIGEKFGSDFEEWLMDTQAATVASPPHQVNPAPTRPRVTRRARNSPGAIERLRRQDMKKHLSKLASFVPSTEAMKSNRAAIIEQTVEYIQSLQKEYKELSDQMRCMEKVAVESDGSSKVDDSNGRHALVNVEGRNVFVTVCSPRATNQLTVLIKMLHIVQSHQLQLVSGSISTDKGGVYHHLHTKQLKADSSIEAIRQAFHDL